MSSVDEMNDRGIEIKKACYYSGINRITYYYRKKHENIEDKRYITRIDSSIVNKIIEPSKERITYGYNRIWALLRNSRIRIARKTVYRIMKNNNLTLPLHNHKNKKERMETVNPYELYFKRVEELSLKKINNMGRVAKDSNVNGDSANLIYRWGIKDC